MLIKAGWNFDADGRKGSIFGMPAGVSLMPPLAAGEALAIELNNISVAAMTVADDTGGLGTVLRIRVGAKP